MTETINYSDRGLNRVLVSMESRFTDYSNKMEIEVDFNAFGLGEFPIFLDFIGIPRHIDKSVFEKAAMLAASRLVRWLVLNGTYSRYPQEESGSIHGFKLRQNRDQDADYYFAFNDKTAQVTIDYPPLSLLEVEESKLARKAIIHWLYHSDVGSLQVAASQVNMPERTVERELRGLASSDLVASGDRSALYLTTMGRQFYESQFGADTGTVFIIAACQPTNSADDNVTVTAHNSVLEVYKRAAQDAGYIPRFQEHEEPVKNIYVDIFDYIDTCEFVIADLTWERPNCYVEIGYAIAKQKPILLFVEESYLAQMPKQQLPFDLAPVKYQQYARSPEGMTKLEGALRERINVLIQRKALSV